MITILKCEYCSYKLENDTIGHEKDLEDHEENCKNNPKNKTPRKRRGIIWEKLDKAISNISLRDFIPNKRKSFIDLEFPTFTCNRHPERIHKILEDNGFILRTFSFKDSKSRKLIERQYYIKNIQKFNDYI